MDSIAEIKRRDLKALLGTKYGMKFDKMNKAICPFHLESDPSLHVRQESGLWLWHCFGCKKGGSLIDFVMEKEGIDLRDAINRCKEMIGMNEIIAAYDYKDVDGKLLYQCVRLKDKSFRYRQPDGNGDWIWNTKGVKRVPYKLPEIVKASRVFIVEGEKDVNNVNEKLGLVATTNPNGAGKWKDEYSQYLKDKEVIVIPDNDIQGKHHASDIAKSLFGIAKQIKVVELPNLPEKGDISDWLSNGGSKEELEQLIKKSSPLGRDDIKAIDSNQFKLTPVKDLLLDTSFEKIKWLVEGLIPKNTLVMISGQPGHFKTWLSLELAIAVSSGKAFLGREVCHLPVIYIDKENSRYLLRERLRMLDNSDGGNLNFWLRDNDPPYLNDEHYIKLAKQNPNALIIFDSLRRFHDRDENDSREMAWVMNQLIDLVNTEATVFVIHHQGKGEFNQYRGSSDILASVDVGLTISKKKNNQNKIILDLGCAKHRYMADFSLIIQVHERNKTFFFEDITDKEKQKKEIEIRSGDKKNIDKTLLIIEEYFAENGNPPNQSQIISIARDKGLSKAKVFDLLKSGEDKDWIVAKGARNQSHYYPFSVFQFSKPLYSDRKTGKQEDSGEAIIEQSK